MAPTRPDYTLTYPSVDNAPEVPARPEAREGDSSLPDRLRQAYDQIDSLLRLIGNLESDFGDLCDFGWDDVPEDLANRMAELFDEARRCGGS